MVSVVILYEQIQDNADATDNPGAEECIPKSGDGQAPAKLGANPSGRVELQGVDQECSQA
jgi:hypothetical protein